MYITPNKRDIQIIIFLYLHKNICCRYHTHYKHLAEALLMSTHNMRFLWRNPSVEKSALSGAVYVYICIFVQDHSSR